MLISVTKPSEEHVMHVQLHGLGSRMFQFEKNGEGGDVFGVWSHEKRVEASWFAEKTRP